MDRTIATIATTAAFLVVACGGSPPSPATPGRATSPVAATATPTAKVAQATPTPFGVGPWIAYQASGANGYGVQLLPIGGGHGRPGTERGLGGWQEHPDWSPDGRRFVFTIKSDSDQGDLWVADAATGDSKKVVGCDAPCVWVDEAAWSPDGRTIAFQRGTLADGVLRSTLELLDLETMHASVVIELPVRFVALAPRWSADQLTMVVEEIELPEATIDAGPIAGTVGLIDLRHPKKIEPLVPFTWKANNPDWSVDGRLITFSAPTDGGEPGGAKSDLWTIHPDGTDLRQLTDVAKADGLAIQPTFLPGGGGVVFAYSAKEDPELTMAIVDLDGTGLRSATGDQWVIGSHPRIRPTG
jgi:TolB protein